MKTIWKCVLIIAMLGLPLRAGAQEVTRLPAGTQQSIGIDAGLEAAFVARATYTRRLDLGFLRDTRFYARATMPFATPDLGDWGVDAGLRATVLAWRDLRLAVLTGPFVRNTSNQLYAATGLGLGAALLAGYEGARWGLSLEAGYERMLATHLRQSDLYRDTFYMDARDGWYALSGSMVHAGLRGGVRIGSFEIFAKAGVAASESFNPMLPPFYATLGSAYAF